MSELDEQREEHRKRAETKYDQPSGTELAQDAESQQKAQDRLAQNQPGGQKSSAKKQSSSSSSSS